MNDAPLKVDDTVWYIGNTGRDAEALPEDCKVKVVGNYQGLVVLANGARLHPRTLRGEITVRTVEDFGRVKVSANPERWEERKREVTREVPVRAFRSKEHWQRHVETTRAWAKLLSRMQMWDQENMERFTVADIAAAELAIFGDIEQ